MPKPKKPGTIRFPLVFHPGNRDHADAIAKAEHGGNLTAYLNALIVADRKKRERKG